MLYVENLDFDDKLALCTLHREGEFSSFSSDFRMNLFVEKLIKTRKHVHLQSFNTNSAVRKKGCVMIVLNLGILKVA